MAEIKQKNLDEWKNTLRSAFILAITGDSSEKAKAFIDIGGYYLCYAPTSLYKYYSDDPMHFEAVKNNQMWYSAPCNFNDVFDCTLTIEEKKYWIVQFIWHPRKWKYEQVVKRGDK